MKKIISILLVCLMVVPFGMLATVGVSAADDAVLYVKDGATGDGSSADKALGTMEEAYDAAIKSGKNTTIVLVGDVHFDMQDTYGFYPEDHAGKITITGKHGAVSGGRLLIAAGDHHNWVLGGETEFNNVELDTWAKDSDSKPNIVFRCHFHPFTFGENVVTADTLGVYVVGGVVNARPFGSPNYDGSTPIVDTYKYDEESNSYTGDINITLKSGNFKEIGIVARAGINTGATVKGTANLTITGTAKIEKIAAFRNTGSAMSGDVNVYLDGGTVTNFLCHNHGSASAVTGVTAESKFTVVITKNFNIAESFTNPPSGDFYQGIAGSTLTVSDAATVLANELFGDYRVFVEASVFDDVVNSQKVFLDSFNTFSKVEDGKGLEVNAKTATPEKSDVEMPKPPVTDETTEAPAVDSKPAETDKVTTTQKADETTKAPAAETSASTQKADSTTAAPADDSEGGFPVWIIGVIAGVVVVAVVAVVIIKKKKAE